MKSNLRAASLAVAACLLVNVSTCLGEDGAQAKKQAPTLVRFPVNYAQTALIVVSPEGVGAVRFGGAFGSPDDVDADNDETFGVEYEYRFLSRQKDTAEISGSGRVFSKLVDGEITPGFSAVRCKAASIKWSYKDRVSGFVEFDPQKLDVHPMTASDFGPGEFAARNVRDPIDLTLFLDTRSNIRKAIDTGIVQNGNRRKQKNVSAPLPYKVSTLVVRNDAGVATFRYGETFEREPTETEKHYVAPFEYSFRTHDGKTVKEGEGEVYELYEDNKYKGGKLDMEAGPITLHWSRGGPKNGWIYYDPGLVQIWTVDQAANLDQFVKAVSQKRGE